ncbi:C-type lectin domain family 4 member M [Oncorhynchus tshawytscha]|uniref:C-type lectin domain family 4 member M n=1 Tax=Oncorhynchus tshawytscha TaxID=74940 RepID=UPI001C3E72FE|nr:C-type lectin domain family 4 member M [Oncorhynchus tshawytscha]
MYKGIYEYTNGFEDEEPNEIKTIDIDDPIYNNKRPIMPCKKDQHSVYLWRWKRHFPTAAVCLGLLCVLLLAWIIGLLLYQRNQLTSSDTLTKERDQLQTSYNTLTKERDQLQTSFNNLTKERDQIQTSFNTPTKVRDQLQTSYNTPTKVRDQLQTSYNTDQIQTSYNTLTKERDQLQTNYNTLTKERDQLQTSNNTLTAERDQLQTSYNTLTKQRDQLQTSYNSLTKERDQLQTSYNTLSKERDQLQTSNNTLTAERDQLQTDYNTLTEQRDQLETSCNTLTAERDQIQTNNNSLTKERDQLQTSNNTLTEERDQLQKETECLKQSLVQKVCLDGWKKLGSSCYYVSTEYKSWEESRQDCRNRGADLVVIKSEDDQTFVNWLCGVKNYVWIGLTDSVSEGTWKWVDDTPLTTKYWNSKEPNGGGAENCVYFYSWSSDTGEWWDYDCSYKYRWICEK